MRLHGKRCWIANLLLCVAFAWLAARPAPAADGGENQAVRKPAAEQPEQEEPAAEAAEQEKPAEEPDPYAVPEGTPAELVKFVQGILSKRPPNAEAQAKAIAAIREASGRILAGEPNDAEAQLAVQWNTMFATSVEELEALAEKLKEAGKTKLLRQVRGAVLGRQLREVTRGAGDESKKRLGELVEEVKKHLAEGPLGRSDVSLALNAGRAVEASGNTELAAETYATLAKLLAASEDETIAKLGKTMEGIGRRLNLVGKEMEVEGIILGGEKFDWSKYRGKVVLVDFWASWCGPCVREVPNMKDIYAQYHDRGFDIVGISLDRSREQLEAFLKEKQIPWTILYKDEERSPTIAYYGVMAIPAMILVDKDGKVVSTRARGEQLRTELEKLLGPAEEQDKTEAGQGDEEKAAETEG